MIFSESIQPVRLEAQRKLIAHVHLLVSL